MITTKSTKVSLECLSVVNTAHTMIAGTTGSGKSVLLNSIIFSLLKSWLVNEEFGSFVMIDPKRVELKMYKDLPNVAAYVTEPEEVPDLLDRVIDHMDNIYENMDGRETTNPHLYVVIDELADLLNTEGVLERLVKIGRLGRAAHIHLLMCTQDPSRNTLTAQIMQNITTSVALRCKDTTESRQIIKRAGAESLPPYGMAIVSDPMGWHKMRVPLTPDEDIQDLIDVYMLMHEGKHHLINTLIEPGLFSKSANDPKLALGAIW